MTYVGRGLRVVLLLALCAAAIVLPAVPSPGATSPGARPAHAQGVPFAFGKVVDGDNGQELGYWEAIQGSDEPRFCWWIRIWWFNGSDWSTVNPYELIEAGRPVEDVVEGIAAPGDILLWWIRYDQLTARTPAVFDPFDTSEWTFSPGSPLDPDFTSERSSGRLLLQSTTFSPTVFGGLTFTLLERVVETRVEVDVPPAPVVFVVDAGSPAFGWTPPTTMCGAAAARPSTPTPTPTPASQPRALLPDPATATITPTWTSTPTSTATRTPAPASTSTATPTSAPPTRTPTPTQPAVAKPTVEYFVFILPGVSNGAFWIGTEADVKARTTCSFTGGGNGCSPSERVKYQKLAGPFPSRPLAVQGLKTHVDECLNHPIGGLYGKTGGTFYGLWNVPENVCP